MAAHECVVCFDAKPARHVALCQRCSKATCFACASKLDTTWISDDQSCKRVKTICPHCRNEGMWYKSTPGVTKAQVRRVGKRVIKRLKDEQRKDRATIERLEKALTIEFARTTLLEDEVAQLALRGV